MYLHGFFEKSKKEATEIGIEPSLKLFGTWITNRKYEIQHIVMMPFHTNNVDVTVNSNLLVGI